MHIMLQMIHCESMLILQGEWAEFLGESSTEKEHLAANSRVETKLRLGLKSDI